MRGIWIITLVVVLIAGIGGYLLYEAQYGDATARAGLITKSMDNLRSLALFLGSTGEPGKLGALQGKNLVLGLVARGAINPHRPHELGFLFSPSRGAHPLEGVDTTRYGLITLERLARGEDFSDLTSYAGARRPKQPSKRPATGWPILADAGIPGVVLVAYTSGAVEVHTYAELGVPENGPVTFGEHAPSEVLRLLSDR